MQARAPLQASSPVVCSDCYVFLDHDEIYRCDECRATLCPTCYAECPLCDPCAGFPATPILVWALADQTEVA